MPLVQNKNLKNILADGRLLMTDLSWYFERWNLSWTLKDVANIRDLLVWGQHPVTTGWCSSVKTQVSLNSSWALQMWEMHNRGYSEPVCLLILIQQLEGTKPGSLNLLGSFQISKSSALNSRQKGEGTVSLKMNIFQRLLVNSLPVPHCTWIVTNTQT